MPDDIEAMRRKAEELLSQAAATSDMRERGRLIDLAANWHQQALVAAGLAKQDNDLEASE